MFISLRTKLILVMSLVVAAATGSTSWITQGFVERTYERRFVDDFKAEIRTFSGRQLERLDRVRKNCQEQASSAVLVKAMQSGSKDKIKEAIKTVTGSLQTFVRNRDEQPVMGPQGFLTMDNQFRGALGRPPSREGSPGDGQSFNKKRPSDSSASWSTPKPPSEPPVGVLDANGELLNPADIFLPMLRLGNKGSKKPDELRTMLKRMSEKVDREQEVTYQMNPGGLPLEVIITPIIDPKTRQPLGALVVGVPMSDLGERALHAFSQRANNGSKADDEEGISSGFWLDGHLHTQTIPESAREEIATAVGQRIEEVKDEDYFHDIRVNLRENGKSVPHKVLFRVLNPDSPFPPAAQVCLYSMASEVAEVREIQSRIIGTGALALAVALALILIVTYRLTQPIRALVAGTEAVRRGDYDISVPVTTHDEIGALAASFNEMTEGLKMKQKYQRVLAQVADPEVADQLMNNETALGGEMRDVTMLFCDIRGFTSLTSGMAPDEVIDMLNEHMTAMTAIVYEHGGVVDKFVGDMVMALFGAPTTHGFDALRATRCAVRMVEERERLNTAGNWRFQVGIGIATGRVIAGCMGSEERMDYTVLGERVNLASRLCTNAAEGQVMIDDVTLAILEETVIAEVLPGLALKGFPSTVTAYRVVALKA